MKKLLSIAVVVMLAGCTVPVSQTGAPQTQLDKDTTYSVEDRADGLLVAVTYSRYQGFPESSAVQTSCVRALTATAHEQAEKRGRKIEPVSEQRIRVSMGRNILTGITSCEASVPVFWVK